MRLEIGGVLRRIKTQRRPLYRLINRVNDCTVELSDQSHIDPVASRAD